MKYGFLVFGIFFGFVMSRAGATTFDYYAELFLFRDFQLLWVITGAVVVGVIGIQIMRRLRLKSIVDGSELSYTGKPMKKGLIFGALLFGLGWGLTGSCPGSALIMVGEGKFLVLSTILGMIAGTYIFAMLPASKKQ